MSLLRQTSPSLTKPHQTSQSLTKPHQTSPNSSCCYCFLFTCLHTHARIPQCCSSPFNKRRYRSPIPAVCPHLQWALQSFHKDPSRTLSVHTADHITAKETTSPTLLPTGKSLQSFLMKTSPKTKLTKDRCCFQNTGHSNTRENFTVE